MYTFNIEILLYIIIHTIFFYLHERKPHKLPLVCCGIGYKIKKISLLELYREKYRNLYPKLLGKMKNFSKNIFSKEILYLLCTYMLYSDYILYAIFP